MHGIVKNDIHVAAILRFIVLDLEAGSVRLPIKIHSRRGPIHLRSSTTLRFTFKTFDPLTLRDLLAAYSLSSVPIGPANYRHRWPPVC